MEEIAPGQFREIYAADPAEPVRFCRIEQKSTGVVFTIQHRYGGEGEWVFSSYDNIAVAARQMPGYLFLPNCYGCPVEHGFSLLNEAVDALRAVREANRDLPHRFRLVSVEYTCLIRSFDL